MRDILFELLFAVITFALTAATTALTVFLKSKIAQVKNETSRELLYEINEAISTAVTATSQTYVDQLKKSGDFSKENQAKALKKAKETFMTVISADAEKLLNTMYESQESLDDYLTAKIEEQVKVQKETLSLPSD